MDDCRRNRLYADLAQNLAYQEEELALKTIGLRKDNTKYCNLFESTPLSSPPSPCRVLSNHAPKHYDSESMTRMRDGDRNGPSLV
jgi:hypothetical protein